MPDFWQVTLIILILIHAVFLFWLMVPLYLPF